MADRTIGVVTTLFIAILTGRAIQISSRDALPVYEDAFYSPYINWSRSSDPEWVMEPFLKHSIPTNFNQTIQRSQNYYAVNLINKDNICNNLLRKRCPIVQAIKYDTVFVMNNRGRTIRMFEHPAYSRRLKDMGLTPYSAFGCLLNFALQPKPDIFLPVFDQFEVLTRSDPLVLKIAIQIRTGDHLFLSDEQSGISYNNAKEVLQNYKDFFACAEEIETFAMANRYTSAVWYLATESQAIRHAAIEVFGSKVVTSLTSKIEHSSKENFDCSSGSSSEVGGEYGTPLSPGRNLDDLRSTCAVSQEGFYAAAAEWWMLGYADYHVITVSSGFGRSGAFRAMQSDRIYTIYKDHPVSCSKNSFTQLEDLMYDWSGI